MSDWKPIETAPRDGTKFLFVESGGRMQIGRFSSEWGEPPSVFVCLTGNSSDFYPTINPTHWQPLPEPPK